MAVSLPSGGISALLIAGERSPCDLHCRALADAGVRVHSVPTGVRAEESMRARKHDIVLFADPTLVNEPLLRELRALDPCVPFLVMHLHPSDTVDDPGLDDLIFGYISRPLVARAALPSVYNAARHRRALLELARRSGRSSDVLPEAQYAGGRAGSDLQGELVGASEAIERVRRQLLMVAASNMTVLLQGESGTGKDVAARLLHAHSPRNVSGSLVKISCPTVPESLIESELFGHEAGAFTGAAKAKPGLFEMADRGTLFLDEVGELPPQVQAKLLQVLEHRQFTRVGGRHPVFVDARIVAATNADLASMVRAGAFRPDLYYRLSQYTVRMPALRERLEDIPELVAHFVEQFATRYDVPAPQVSDRALARLCEHGWTGNVRELESAVHRFVVSQDEQEMLAGLDDARERDRAHEGDAYRESERRAIVAALTRTHWNRRQAAKVLGISYNTLRRRIDAFALNGSDTGATV